MSIGIDQNLFNYIIGSTETNSSSDTTKYEEIDDLKSSNDFDCTIEQTNENLDDDYDIPEKYVIQNLLKQNDFFETKLPKIDDEKNNDNIDNFKIKDAEIIIQQKNENIECIKDKSLDENCISSIDDKKQETEKQPNEDKDKQNIETSNCKNLDLIEEESFDKKVLSQLENVILRKSTNADEKRNTETQNYRELRGRHKSRVKKPSEKKIQEKKEMMKKVNEENTEIKLRLIEINNELELLKAVYRDMNPGKELPLHLEKGYSVFKDTLNRFNLDL